MSKKLKTTENSPVFKPFSHEWAFEAWRDHEKVHWLFDEIALTQDVSDYKNKLTHSEREFIRQILMFFTQGDVDVAEYYVTNVLPFFNNNEIRMMVLGFASRETIHQSAYSHLVETLGLPDRTYTQFMEYEAMANKHEYTSIHMLGEDATPKQIAASLALFSGFTEGVQLFSSFVMLLNFARTGTMMGVGKIVTMSMIDENKHVEGMTKLFKTYVRENKILDDDLKKIIYDSAEKMVELEFAFIDFAFSGSDDFRGLAIDDLKNYIKYIADRRLLELGLKPIFKVKKNPLPWVSIMISAPKQENFFEQSASDYSKGNFSGNLDDIWNPKV
jgi:ribonucleoside-diphosphate reductase beta chain